MDWIRVDFERLDPDIEEQKLPTRIEIKKVKKFHALKCWTFSFES
jgi:hypothetical protein